MRGNCYVTSEALFHLLGGRKAGWKAYVMRVSDAETHWFLMHESGLLLDPTVSQFGGRIPKYTTARGTGFLTKRPSKRARELMKLIVWQEEE